MKKITKLFTRIGHLKIPYVDFCLQIPLLFIRTNLMVESRERYTYEYIGVYITFLKWEFKFRLYEPGATRR